MAFFSSPPYELKSKCTPATLRPPVLGSVIAMHCARAGHTSAQRRSVESCSSAWCCSLASAG